MFKLVSLCGALCLFAAGIACASALSTHAIPLPGHGTLTIVSPEAWHMAVSQPPQQLPPTIKFSQGNGEPFVMLITPLWKMGQSVPAVDLESLRHEVQKSANDAAPHSVEGTLKVQQLTGKLTSGYYFSATDSAPGPGEYKYLMQGIVRTENLAVTFTVLTNDKSGSIAQSALTTLRSVTHK